MKTLKYEFKNLFLLILAIGLLSCSNDDDNVVDEKDEGPLEGQATAVIAMDNETIQFSAKNENSFAGIVNANVGENEIKQLVIVMADDDSDILIVTQAAPAPNGPTTYDVSETLTEDYLFTTSVAVEGQNSAVDKIYGVGVYQHEDEIVLQSQGSFKITSLTSENIKGTFEMTLYNIYDPNNVENAKELTVTEGKFNLPIVEIGEGDLDFN